eukprot:g8039.t1
MEPVPGTKGAYVMSEPFRKLRGAFYSPGTHSTAALYESAVPRENHKEAVIEEAVTTIDEAAVQNLAAAEAETHGETAKEGPSMLTKFTEPDVEVRVAEVTELRTATDEAAEMTEEATMTSQENEPDASFVVPAARVAHAPPPKQIFHFAVRQYRAPTEEEILQAQQQTRSWEAVQRRNAKRYRAGEQPAWILRNRRMSTSKEKQPEKKQARPIVLREFGVGATTTFRQAPRTSPVASAPHKITKSTRRPQHPAEAQRDENARRKPRRLEKGKRNEVERKRRKHQASAKDAKTSQPKWIEKLLQDEAKGLAAPKADDSILLTRGPGRSQNKATLPTADSPVASAAASEAVLHLSPAIHDAASRPTTLRRMQTIPHDRDGYCGLTAVGRLLQIKNPRKLRKQVAKAITDKSGRKRILKQGVTTLKQIHTILVKNKIAAVAYPVHEWPKESGAVFLTPEQMKKSKVIGSKEVRAAAGLVAGGGHVEVLTERQWAELSIGETTLTKASASEQELNGSLHGKKAKIKMSLPALKKNIATLLQIKDTTEIPIFEQASSGSLRVLSRIMSLAFLRLPPQIKASTAASAFQSHEQFLRRSIPLQ